MFIVACWAAFWAFLAVGSVKTKRTVEGSRLWIWWGGGWWTRLVFLIIVVGFVAISAAFGGGSNFIPHRGLATEIAADVVTFVGFVVAVWARSVLGGNWSAGVTFKERHDLIQRGPYRYVRHPMYSGLLLSVLGLVIWFGRVNTLAVFLISFAGVLLRSRQEEKLLTVHFSTAYPEYRKRTKALIPFVL